MDNSGPRTIRRPRNGSSSICGSNGGPVTVANRPLYRQHSNMSNTSFASDVEMAHHEVFAGPMSESVPSSVTGFAHQRPRTDSIASFTYFQEEDDSPDWSEDSEVLDEDEGAMSDIGPQEGNLEYDVEAASGLLERRKSSNYSRTSVEDPLLLCHDSSRRETGGHWGAKRTSQKIHVVSEDLTIVVAGFSTRPLGFGVYILLCIASAGLGYIILRWLPRWKVYLVGTVRPLAECTWVVVENQWGELTCQDIMILPYGHSMGSVFGSRTTQSMPHTYDYDDEDPDPILKSLRFLDYRYLRFGFHPQRDKFVSCNNWNESRVTDVMSMRAGLDGVERQRKKQVFGNNSLDIREKSMLQLLIDEVSLMDAVISAYIDEITGFASVLYIPGCKSHSLVFG